MKSPTDNPVDPLGSLGAPIRPAAPAPVPASKPFETGDWAPKGLVINDKPASPVDPLDVPIIFFEHEWSWTL